MKKINFAYDGEVGRQVTWRWHINSYDNKFYPINGLFEDCYYDYHAPLQTVFEKNGYETSTITVKEALKREEKFIYVLTFRYLLNTILNDLEYNFFLHLPIGLIDAINSGKCVLVLNDGHESAFYSKQFYDQLLSNFKNARIDSEKLILITGNPSNTIEESPVKLVFWQYFETAVRMAIEKVTLPAIEYVNSSILKKFLCLNRMPRETRYFFMYQMYKRNLLGDFNASLDKVNSLTDIVSYNNNIFLDSLTDKTDFNKMLQTLPWIVDTNEFKVNHWDTNNINFPRNNLIFITTETLFGRDMKNLFLTEKTFKPISLQMPFIIIGQPGTLARLHRLGYKTFNDFWDESYDQELDPLVRMDKISNLVEYLAKFTTEDLKSLISNTKDILEHNIKILQSRKPEMEIIECIKEKL